MMVFCKCWLFMKEDILSVVHDLMLNSHIDWRLKSTFITLIPKVNEIVNVLGFIPISLMGSANNQNFSLEVKVCNA